MTPYEKQITTERAKGISLALIAKHFHTGRDKVEQICRENMTPEALFEARRLCYSIAGSRDKVLRHKPRTPGYTLAGELNQCAAKWLHDWKPA